MLSERVWVKQRGGRRRRRAREAVLGLVLLNPGQYAELWVTDESGSGSVTITDLQVTIVAAAG